MKTARKAILLVMCALLLVAASVMGTLAYLTDTEEVTNTFTVGKVDITLDEADTDNDKNKADNVEYTVDGVTVTRDKANAYHLLPGGIYEKDPTIHVTADSEACYLFVKVVNGISDIEAGNEDGENGYKTIADQMAANGWESLNNGIYYLTETNTAGGKVPKLNNKGTNPVVFSQFKIDGTKAVNVPEGQKAPEGKYDIAKYTTKDNGVKIIVTAYAIQAEGFANAEAAWSAYTTQHPQS